MSKKSRLMEQRKKERRKKRLIYGSIGAVSAIVAVLIVWYSLFLFELVKYTPVQIITGKNKPRCEVSEYIGLSYTKCSDELAESDYKDYYSVMLSNRPNYKKLEDREGTSVHDGDILCIDFAGKLDGELFEGGTSTNYYLKIGSNTFIDGFEESLIGETIGSEVDINVTFPESYPNNPDLAGKPVVFTVTIHSACEQLTEVTDEYIVENTDYESIKDFEDKFLTNELKEKKAEANYEAEHSEVISALVSNTEFYNLDEEISDYYKSLVTYYQSIAANSYNTDFATYVRYAQGTTEELFLNNLKSLADTTIKTHYALKAVAKKEKLKVTKDIYKKYVEDQAIENGYKNVSEFEADNSKDDINEMILYAYVTDYIFDKAVAK